MGVIDDIKTNLRNAYTKLETKGATIPAHKNMENLENTIDSIAVAKAEQAKTVDLSMASGDQVIVPDTNKVLSQVTINKPATLSAENIKNGIDIGGVVGSFAGGASLNIHYGNTAPSDTTKLWVKATDPTEIEISGNVNTSSGNATSISTMAGNLRDGCIAVVDNKLYLFGGYGTIDGVDGYKRTIYCLDLATNTMTLKNAQLSKNTIYISCAVVGKKVYLTGGNNSAYGDIYDTENDTITTTSLSPYESQANYDIPMAVVGTDIYMFGGSNGSAPANNSIYKYDTLTNTRSVIQGVTTNAKLGMGVVTVGTDIYLIGGTTNGNDTVTSIQKFDTLTNTITTLSDLSLPNGIAEKSWVSVLFGNKIYLFKKMYAPNDVNYEIDIVNKTINQFTGYIPTLYGGYCCQNGYDVYLAFITSDTNIYKMSFSIILNEGKMLLNYNTSGDFNIINTDTIKVKINPIDCYKGDSNNIGQQVKIALYDSTQQDWVEIN